MSAKKVKDKNLYILIYCSFRYVVKRRFEGLYKEVKVIGD